MKIAIYSVAENHSTTYVKIVKNPAKFVGCRSCFGSGQIIAIRFRPEFPFRSYTGDTTKIHGDTYYKNLGDIRYHKDTKEQASSHLLS